MAASALTTSVAAAAHAALATVPGFLRGPRGSIASPACADHIRFLMASFGAKVLGVFPSDGLTSGKPIDHATLLVNGGLVYIFDSSSFDTGACSNGEATCSIALNISCATADEARACFAAALKAGATEAHKFEQGPWQTEGSLFGAVRDSWGFRWTIDFEPVVDRLKFAAKIMADIAAAEVASSSS